jgi:hypothetical protein
MQDAEDRHRPVTYQVINDVLFDRIRADAIAEVFAQASTAGETGKVVDSRDDPLDVRVSLPVTLALGRVQRDAGQIGLGLGRDDRRVTGRHPGSAYSPVEPSPRRPG